MSKIKMFAGIYALRNYVFGDKQLLALRPDDMFFSLLGHHNVIANKTFPKNTFPINEIDFFLLEK
ncbi:MAG: hypothetical protein HN955_18830 [Prolixibacteraceae bacterium]|nr:hypothetical protein [Prolixibacteraceae bacterium]MBT7000502.1 hypothetical protein [Prolixibacteraceae bacterium]